MMQNSTPRIAFLLAIFVWSLFLLTDSKTLQIGADEAVVYATAESLAGHGGFEVDQIASLGKGEIWAYGLWGPDGHQYGKYGPVQPFLTAPFVWIAWHLPGIGPVDTALLFNGLVTAATVGLLFGVSRMLGFSPLPSLLAALLFGFATFAWPYSKTFFGEPLSALLLLAAIAGALRIRSTGQASAALWSGICLGLAIGVKWSNGVVALPLLVFVLAITTKQRRLLIAWASPLAVTLGFLLWFNLARFGSPGETGYSPEAGFSTPILYGLWGLLLSPGKSLFLYSPILLLALPGIWLFWKKDRAATFLLLGASLAQLLLYAGWWAWWGGWGWGPRLLLPATPPLMLLALPLLERFTARPLMQWPNLFLIGLATLSLGIQLLGISVHYAVYLGEQSQSDPLVNGPTVSDPAQSPLVAQLRYLRAPYWDLAWVDGGKVDGIHLVAKVGFVLIAATGLFVTWQRGALGVWVPLLALGTVVAALGLVRMGMSVDDEYRALAEHLSTTRVDWVVLSDYLRQATFWNVIETSLPIIGAPESPTLPPHLEALLQRALNSLAENGGEIVQLAQNPPGDAASGVERWLAARLYVADHQWYGPTRLLRYLHPPRELEMESGASGVVFGDWAVLEAYEVKLAADALYITLTWRAMEPTQVPYSISLQWLDGDGNLVAQHDGEPAAATRPTTAWKAGELILDRHALRLAVPSTPGQLWVILYDPATGQRLMVADDEGKSLGDAYPLLTLP